VIFSLRATILINLNLNLNLNRLATVHKRHRQDRQTDGPIAYMLSVRLSVCPIGRTVLQTVAQKGGTSWTRGQSMRPATIAFKSKLDILRYTRMGFSWTSPLSHRPPGGISTSDTRPHNLSNKVRKETASPRLYAIRVVNVHTAGDLWRMRLNYRTERSTMWPAMARLRAGGA